MAVTSSELQSDGGRLRTSAASGVPPLTRSHSRMNVDRVLRHAFQYVWNWSSEVGFDVMLRHVTTSRPVIVFVDGSSSTSIE